MIDLLLIFQISRALGWNVDLRTGHTQLRIRDILNPPLPLHCFEYFVRNINSAQYTKCCLLFNLTSPHS